MSEKSVGICTVCGGRTNNDHANVRSWRVVRTDSTRSAEVAMAGFPQAEDAYITGYRIREMSHPVPDTYVCNACIKNREHANRPAMKPVLWLSKVTTMIAATVASILWLADAFDLATVSENWLYIPVLTTMAAGFVWSVSGADDELHRIAPIDQWHAEGLSNLELPFKAKLCPGLFDLEDEIYGVGREDQYLPLPQELAVVRADQVPRLLNSQAETGYAHFNCQTKLHYAGLSPARPTGLIEHMPQYRHLGELLAQEGKPERL